MNQNLSLALKAARKAGEYLFHAQRKGNIDVSWKHEGESCQEPLTKFDKESQKIIKKTLAPSGLPFWGEESEKVGTPNGWIVDPIDGTGSFAKGNAEWGVSIALVKEGKTEIGVIALPRLDIVFHAVCGSDAWKGSLLNKKSALQSFSIYKKNFLRKAGDLKLLIDIPFDKSRAISVNQILSNIGECKSSKSATFHMMQVLYSQRLDAYYQEKAGNIFDVAAACLIAKEAGAVVTLTNGKSFELMKDNILVARNEKIARAIIERVKNLS
jgi:myo-inositol-1(or 4)-monophosphatase